LIVAIGSTADYADKGQLKVVRDVSTSLDMTKKGGGALDGKHLIIIAFGYSHL
jgi:hypothetical protein